MRAQLAAVIDAQGAQGFVGEGHVFQALRLLLSLFSCAMSQKRFEMYEEREGEKEGCTPGRFFCAVVCFRFSPVIIGGCAVTCL